MTDSDRDSLCDVETGVSNPLPGCAVTGVDIDALVEGYAGRGYGDLKKDTADAVVEYVTPIKARVDEFGRRPERVGSHPREGRSARDVFRRRSGRVYERLGPAVGQVTGDGDG